MNVHIVPHSHDDVGWLKTADEYFYGLNRTIAPGAVKLTLDTVYSELKKNPARKYSQCESAFFWRWYKEQDDATRHSVKTMANSGQLEFINGGWVMNDEAAAHYQAIVDQMSFGLRYLNSTFGKCGQAKVGWQIDPFGHSKEMANLFAQMGMEAFFFSRLHYNDHKKRIATKTMNLIWRASSNASSSDGDIFTSVMYDGYGPPPEFCFDAYCNDDLLAADKSLENYNLDDKLAKLTKWANKQKAAFKSNHIMLPMGSDFQYTNAQMWYENLDGLINFANEKAKAGESKLSLFYSTPTCYERAARNAEDISSTAPKTDDFFPYASDYESYWAGYFTSRPGLKGYVRVANNYLQVCKQLEANAQLDDGDRSKLEFLERAMGTAQHHDAVSGTAKQHVTDDYEKMLANGLHYCEGVANDALAILGKIKAPFSFCLYANQSVCPPTQSMKTFSLTVLNGYSHNYTAVIRVPINQPSATVKDSAGRSVLSQLIFSYVPASQLGYTPNPAPYTLLFYANLPPLGFEVFTVITRNDLPSWTMPHRVQKLLGRRREWKKRRSPAVSSSSSSLSISNSRMRVDFDSATGLMKTISASGLSLPVRQELLFYVAANDSQHSRASGAYIFRPNTTSTHRIAQGSVRTLKTVGSLTQEVRQVFGDWASQIVRLQRDAPFVEVEWTVGPIPYHDKTGREIIAHYATNIASAGRFLTDSNGRQLLERRRNFAPTYRYNNSQPAAGNYYPVDALIAIRDSKSQLTVLTDRAQGGSSLQDGAVELMLHRRLFVDDGFGVAEPLNETGVDGRGLVVKGRHWIFLTSPSDAAKAYRPHMRRLFSQPILAASPPLSKPRSFSALRRALPPNVSLMTLEQMRGTMSGRMSLLIRFEHIYQAGEDAKLSQKASFTLGGLFRRFEIDTCEELSLAANQATTKNRALHGLQVTLLPMQIVTLECLPK